MLVVRFELWPGGREEGKRSLGTVVIANDGSGDDATGNYVYRVTGKGGASLKAGEGKIKGYKRQRHISWKLVWEVLDKMFKERDNHGG